ALGDENGPQMAYGDGYLFVADGPGGLVAIDVSDANQPVIAGRLALPGNAVGVALANDRIFVVADGGGLFVAEWTPAHGLASNGMLFAEARGFDGRLQPALAQPAEPALSPDCLVATTEASGPGSVQDCLSGARTGTIVTFDPSVFPSAEPATIELARTVVLASGATLDGSGAGVVLDGGGKVDVGIAMNGGSTVRGLTLTGFTEAAVFIEDSENVVADCVISANGDQGIRLLGSHNRIVGNLIGLDPTGSALWGAQKAGINVLGPDNVIGGPDPNDRNVISGSVIGLDVKTVAGNVIEGNYLGTDATGRVELPWPGLAVFIEAGAARTRVAGNVIAGGVQILDPGSSYNTVVGNLVGVDAPGARALEPAGYIAVGEPFNRVGGTLPGEANTVNGVIAAASDVMVLGNRIGTGEHGEPLGHGWIDLSGTRVVIGGRSPSAGNVVYANAGGAITVTNDANVIIGNSVRIDELPDKPEARATDNGIAIRFAESNHIIANTITTRAGTGILLGAGAQATVARGNIIESNDIGVEATGDASANLITGNRFGDNTMMASDLGQANV
ncbi:MAG TPA: right-handed parallel beta-helix repeat-containing protein, partial [Mycobacterium sp.]